MIDVEQQITGMLNNRAADVEVHPDLENILAGARVVLARPTTPTPKRHRRTALLAGIAAIALFALFGFVLLRNDSSPGITVAGDPNEAFYPVLGDLPSSVQTGPFASVLEGPYESAYKHTGVIALVGIPTGDQWTSVSRIMVQLEEPDPDPREEQVEIEFGSITAIKTESIAGSNIYAWQQDELRVSVGTDLSDPTQLLASVRVTGDGPNGPVKLTFDDLPPGFLVLAGPNDLPNSDLLALTTYDGVSPDGEPEVSVSVVETGIAIAGNTGVVKLVDVNGSTGIQGISPDEFDLQFSNVAWQLSDDRTVVLTTRGLTPEETLRIAREVAFVDEATWRTIYEVAK